MFLNVEDSFLDVGTPTRNSGTPTRNSGTPTRNSASFCVDFCSKKCEDGQTTFHITSLRDDIVIRGTLLSTNILSLTGQADARHNGNCSVFHPMRVAEMLLPSIILLTIPVMDK